MMVEDGLRASELLQMLVSASSVPNILSPG